MERLKKLNFKCSITVATNVVPNHLDLSHWMRCHAGTDRLLLDSLSRSICFNELKPFSIFSFFPFSFLLLPLLFFFRFASFLSSVTKAFVFLPEIFFSFLFCFSAFFPPLIYILVYIKCGNFFHFLILNK